MSRDPIGRFLEACRAGSWLSRVPMTTSDTRDVRTFRSRVIRFGTTALPSFTGIRIMMMPFHLEDPLRTLPAAVLPWATTIEHMCDLADASGVGYLTIDEAVVRSGETHRRPGIHVDGVGPDGAVGSWGGGGGYAGREGMLMVASHAGARAWHQTFRGAPGPDGDCAHLAGQCQPTKETVLVAGGIYWCSSMCVHEALPMDEDTQRQFCRISMPSDAPWYDGYTPNPTGVLPTGPVRPRRDAYMSYRSS